MKIIIWGHKLHSHTHSYIHYGFFRAFQSLGYETFWYDNKDDVSNINFEDCLFFTEGQVDAKMPRNKTSKYILHNCDGSTYTDINPANRLNIQFFNRDVLTYNLTRLNPYTFIGEDVVCQPWATDLLPHEINIDEAHNEMHNKQCVWVGSYSPGDHSEYENNTELDPFFNECQKNGISVKHVDPWVAPISPEENRRLVHNSYLAPTINGKFQKKTLYIPCRIFKNISYGHFGMTNNGYVNDIFDGQLVYDPDPTNLFHKSIEKKNSSGILEEIKFLMNEVKSKHTFVNRANVLLDFFK